MTRDEQSLLLYLETCTTDNGGRVNHSRLNEADFNTATRWAREGFIGFGRIAAADVSYMGSHWVRLSDAAWKQVHQLRQARAERVWASRSYRTLEEVHKQIRRLKKEDRRDIRKR